MASSDHSDSGSNSSQASEASVASSSPRHEADGAFDGQPAPSASIASTNFTFVLNDPSHPDRQTSETPTQQHDRFAHTRTKRKRTSAADFAVLEREYELEPRPDRAVRGRIAAQVSLNEKEVQIWFQNRRQMTRRKARTWQPNEISEIIRSSQNTGDSVSPPSSQHEGSQNHQGSDSGEQAPSQQAHDTNERPAQGLFMNASLSTFQQDSNDMVEPVVEGTPEPEPEPERDGPNFEAEVMKRGSARSVSSDASHVQDSAPGRAASPQDHKVLKRTASSVRLRTSLDGKAELVLDKNTPSPPSKTNRRELWPARSVLRRTQSAYSPPTASLDDTTSDFPSSSQPSPSFKDLHRPVGRSRDARTWQFYCDPDAPDYLRIAADHDHRGSAQAALSLIRSNSAATAGTVGSEAAQAPVHRRSDKRKSLEDLAGSRPKLPRTTSSVARLQNTAKALDTNGEPHLLSSSQPVAGSKRKGDKMSIFRDGDSDSDKENWQPGTRMSAPMHPRRAYETSDADRAALGSNVNELSHDGGLGALTNNRNGGNARRRRAARGSASKSKAIDGEVANFMGEKNTSTAAKQGSMANGDDLDAVQNLMRLSQGGRW